MNKDIENLTKRVPKTNNFDKLTEHKRVLNLEVPKKLLSYNKEYSSKYIPLEVVEQMLSALFKHYEVIIPFAPVLMEGQIITVVNLIVHHPITNKELTYSGLSSVPLISANDNFKWNHRNIPASKGFAIMNASKEIGRIFRAEHVDTSRVMSDYFNKKESESEVSIEKSRMFDLINSKKTKKTLMMIFESVKKMDDKEVTSMYKSKMKLLKK